MANTIKLKRGSGSDPGASDLAVGEIAIRTDEGKIFTKKDDGTVAEISGSGGGGTNFTYLALRNAANNGAASYPGNDFTLVTDGTTNAVSPTAANTLLLSYGGVIQQPNSGTSTSGITGFIIDGSRLKTATNFAAAPDFIIYQKGAGIGTPSEDTVDLAQLAHATQGDVLYWGASGAPARLAADNGKFLRSNGNSSNPSWETVTSTPEGTAILSTGESGASKYLREDGDGTCSWQSVPAGITINNQSDNRIISATGTSNTLNSEANLTFDGSTLAVTGNITVSGTVDGIDIATDVAANTAKTTNATHTGEVTGSGALTIADDVVDEANLKVDNSPTNDYVLTAKSSATGGLTWAALPSAGAALTGSTNNTITTVTGSNAIQGEANLTFDGSTLAVTGNQTTTLAVQAQGFECPATVSANWTIGANNNAVFPGPMTVASGVTVTIPANRSLTIV
jgi:hypothetical protein